MLEKQSWSGEERHAHTRASPRMTMLFGHRLSFSLVPSSTRQNPWGYCQKESVVRIFAPPVLSLTPHKISLSICSTLELHLRSVYSLHQLYPCPNQQQISTRCHRLAEFLKKEILEREDRRVKELTSLARHLRVQALVVKLERGVGIYRSIPSPDFGTLCQCPLHAQQTLFRHFELPLERWCNRTLSHSKSWLQGEETVAGSLGSFN